MVGPYSLPDLHRYQRIAVDNVKPCCVSRDAVERIAGCLVCPRVRARRVWRYKQLLRRSGTSGFDGAILWVADRDELCEQAVEVWRQAWGSIGRREAQLRISRFWAGQASPEAIVGAHVIVATVQTLRARMNHHESTRNLLADVGLLVVDEAHGSIAPSYTNLMAELGLTFRRADDEICLLGLTATPYRGRDAEEAARPGEALWQQPSGCGRVCER